MKTGAEKSSSVTQSARHQAASSPFFAKTGEETFFAPARPSVQAKLTIGHPKDKFELEADSMADKVMRMPAPLSTPSPAKDKKLRKSEDERLQKATEPDRNIQKQDDDKLRKSEDNKLQTKENGQTTAPDAVQSGIQNSASGRALPDEVRGFMEPRFNADFSNVRIHDNQEAARLSTRLGARAFAHKNHIFFSRGQYQPGTSQGKHLLAHELTHTIQQGHAVQRAPQVSTASSPPQVQGSVIGRILDWIADKARYIPGFTMFTVVLGVNPINMSTVDRSASNILRAIVELVPGGPLITRALENHGIINRVATWVEGKIRTLGMVGSMFSDALHQFLDSLGLSDLAPWNWGSVWNRAKSIFTAPISRLISFASSLVSEILGFIKEAILKPLAALAQGTRGYDLLRALLGEDPITGEPVPRTPDALIGGFMKLIGQEEVWENIRKGNAIARAWAWFQGVLSGLLGFARSIPRRIIETLTSLTIMDLVTVVGAFRKIGGAFFGIAAEFGSWALNQVISLLEILFSVVAPGVMPYLRKAKSAFVSILKNPIGFVGNLVRAAKLGFQRFAGNIVTHLKTALIKWLVGPLADAGVYIPKSFSLLEIVKLVLSVLGLTWQNIRSKLVKIIPEPVLAGLEKTAGILVTLVKDGPAAAWEQIKAELSELKEQLIAQVTQMVSVEIVKAAVMKLVSMLNPAGAVIQAIIAIYNTITFFIEKARQIAAVVGSFINSIAAIAAGQVNAAANKVEQTLANTLTVVISFLAKFAGIGGIPKKLVGIVKKIRKPIDKGLDKIVAWLGKMLGKMKSAVTEWWKSRKPFTTSKGEKHEVYYSGSDNKAIPMVASKDPKPIEHKLNEFGSKLDSLPADKKGQASTLIAATRTKLKDNPGDPAIVTAMKTLFELFEGDQSGPPKKAQYTPVSGTLPGDSTVVGKSMTIDWLSTEFIASHPGSPPGSGQDALMSKLVVDKKKRSAFKYIRGHLLNEHLGGQGKPENLFPITANANSQHLHSTEKEIKNWVGVKGAQPQTPKKYAFYEVKIDYADSDVDLTNSDVSLNKVDSTMHTRVLLKDDSGTVKKSFMTSIQSRYQHKNKAARYDLQQ